MGEVYRATDMTLGRSVAVKVLHDAVAGDADRLRRFENEARAASALSHPNIVTVYEIGRSSGRSFLATELVQGGTLREAIATGPFSMSRLLDVAVQLADALAAAHDAGIVHRDLSPSNVMLTWSGVVKLLDFGLAKRIAWPADEGESRTRTESDRRSSPGEAVGTAGYMSPEQARGESVDFESDQFSFGCLLYEMATGRRAFSRGSRLETLCAVLTQEPEPVERVQPGIPPALSWIIQRCLAKSPGRRYASTRELADELRSLRDRAVVAPIARPGLDGSRGWRPIVAALIAAASCLVLSGRHRLA